MINGVYQNAASINALQTWNDVIAQNIAASPRAGYKGKTVSFEAALPGGPNALGADGTAIRMPRTITRTRFDQGAVRITDVKTDFAIKGSGYFQLTRPNGEVVYSRDGSFALNRERTLVNQQGLTVMGLGGPIRLIPEGGPLIAEEDGILRQGEQEVGRLSLVEFPRPDLLLETTGGYKINPEKPQAATPVTEPRFVQGAIESSNISPIREMIDMIAVNNASRVILCASSGV